MANKNLIFLTQAAVIAALYTVLTYVAGFMNIAYGPIQFRFSEALTVLPLFTPAAIPGLAIGCLISNLGSPLGVIDWVFGTGATLLAAILTRMLRNIHIKGIPFIALLMPVIVNTIIVGFELSCFSDATGAFGLGHFSWIAFLTAAVSVGIGEFVICYGMGIPLIFTIRKTGLNKLFMWHLI